MGFNLEQLNLDLLKSLCELIHPSGKEAAMTTFIMNYCYKIEGITVEFDEDWNLFITKNTTNPESFPCLVAHQDEILRYTGLKRVRIKGNKIYGYYVNNGKQCGLGLDDCFGIYICLHLLKTQPDLKICFTVQEEYGCLGAETAALNIDFFDNCRYLIEPDRRGGSDLITRTNGLDVTSDEFLKDIDSLLEKYKYKEAIGTMTDIGTLKENVNLSAINVSCGYYNAHTHAEYGNLTELQKCLNFINEVINNNDKIYPHTCKLRWHSSIKDDKYTLIADLEDDTDYYNRLADQCATCRDFDCENCKLW